MDAWLTQCVCLSHINNCLAKWIKNTWKWGSFTVTRKLSNWTTMRSKTLSVHCKMRCVCTLGKVMCGNIWHSSVCPKATSHWAKMDTENNKTANARPKHSLRPQTIRFYNWRSNNLQPFYKNIFKQAIIISSTCPLHKRIETKIVYLCSQSNLSLDNRKPKNVSQS